jgi:hypothetical protein
MSYRSSTLNNLTNTALTGELGSKYDIVKIVAEKIDILNSINAGLLVEDPNNGNKTELDKLLEEIQNVYDLTDIKVEHSEDDTSYWNPNSKTLYVATTEGKSAYEVAKDNGYTGTEFEWLESLKGVKGDEGPQGIGIAGPQGPNGKSAYEVAKDNGYTGTEFEWLESLKGENAIELWLKNHPGSNVNDYYMAMKGYSAYTIWQQETGNTNATIDEYLEAIKGARGFTGKPVFEYNTITGDLEYYVEYTDTDSIEQQVDVDTEAIIEEINTIIENTIDTSEVDIKNTITNIVNNYVSTTLTTSENTIENTVNGIVESTIDDVIGSITDEDIVNISIFSDALEQALGE